MVMVSLCDVVTDGDDTDDDGETDSDSDTDINSSHSKVKVEIREKGKFIQEDSIYHLGELPGPITCAKSVVADCSQSPMKHRVLKQQQ